MFLLSLIILSCVGPTLSLILSCSKLQTICSYLLAQWNFMLMRFHKSIKNLSSLLFISLTMGGIKEWRFFIDSLIFLLFSSLLTSWKVIGRYEILLTNYFSLSFLGTLVCCFAVVLLWDWCLFVIYVLLFLGSSSPVWYTTLHFVESYNLHLDSFFAPMRQHDKFLNIP